MDKGNVMLTPKAKFLEPTILLSLQNVELKERKIILSPDGSLKQKDLPDFIDTEDVISYTGYKKDTICKWCREGKVKAKKKQGRWMVNLKSLQNYLISKSRVHLVSGLVINSPLGMQEVSVKSLVFISYSHMDAEYLKEFRTHVSKRLEKRINIWSDHNILPGTKWKDAIDKAINQSKVAILFISANFFKSPFINDEELLPILKMAEEEGTKVFCVYLRHCDYEEYPEITQYQGINNPNEPISAMDFNGRDVTWVKLIKEVKKELNIKAPR